MSLTTLHTSSDDRRPGRHRGPRGATDGTPAPGPALARHRAEVQSATGRRALATATVAAGLVTGPALAGPASAESYTVEPGDTLSSIAQAHDTTWRDLYGTNRDVLSDPTSIFPGQTLQTPGGGGSAPAAAASDRGRSAAPAARTGTPAQRILAEARKLEGTPYVYGGSTPSGFDCSGFTSYVFAQVGTTIPRTSSAQAAAATPVSRADLRPGDLIFFSPGGSVSHVAIYAGDGMVWEAGSSGTSVRRGPIWDVPRSYGRF